MRSLIASTVVVFSRALCSADDGSFQALAAQRDPAVQGHLEAAISAPNQAALVERVRALRDVVADDDKLVKQVAILATDPGEEHTLSALAILQTGELPPIVIIRTLAPFLDSPNAKLRSIVRDWFQNHDNIGPVGGQGGLQDYFNYVRERTIENADVPVAFTSYLFERSPGDAMLIFNRADNLNGDGLPGRERLKDEIVLAEHVVSNALWYKRRRYDDRFQSALPDAKNELIALGEHEKWWARLYVVQIMQQHPEFREPGLLARLASDEEALVKELAASLQ